MKKDITQFIIEGVDMLGKSSLIRQIQEERGFHFVYHYSKPQLLNYYLGRPNPYFEYQYDSFEEMFNLMQQCCIKMIFDRAHLGEYVYAKRYRDYDGDYVFNLEYEWAVDKLEHTKLILLTTSNFNFIGDDGQSFDVTKREEEQEDFKIAFNRSLFQNKVMVDVHDGNGRFKEFKQILTECGVI